MNNYGYKNPVEKQLFVIDRYSSLFYLLFTVYDF